MHLIQWKFITPYYYCWIELFEAFVFSRCCLWIMFFYLDKTFSRVIWHCKISIDDADHDYSRVEEEGSMEAKPVNELREELGERGEAEESGEQDEGCSCASNFCRKHFTDDDLTSLNVKSQCLQWYFWYLEYRSKSKLSSTIDWENTDERNPANIVNDEAVFFKLIEVCEDSKWELGNTHNQGCWEEERSSSYFHQDKRAAAGHDQSPGRDNERRLELVNWWSWLFKHCDQVEGEDTDTW